MTAKSLEQRFWEKVRKTAGCWFWESARSGGKERYGFFWVGGSKRSEYAHRIAHQLCKGPIVDGAVVMHSCDNGLCVNPDHLFTGTHQDNMRDASNKNRFSFGEENKGGGKLTDQTVRKIKFLEGAIERKKLANALGVGASNLKKIARGEIWARTPNCLKQALA